MRKKLFIAAIVLAIGSMIAGECLFNRSGAQDAPKAAAEPKSKDDLFDVLKKDLESKSAPPVTPPTIPPPVVLPGAPVPSPDSPVPSIPTPPTKPLDIPPPVVNVPPPPTTPQTDAPPVNEPKPNPTPPSVPIVSPSSQVTGPVSPDYPTFPSKQKPADTKDATPAKPNVDLPQTPTFPGERQTAPPTPQWSGPKPIDSDNPLLNPKEPRIPSTSETSPPAATTPPQNSKRGAGSTVDMPSKQSVPTMPPSPLPPPETPSHPEPIGQPRQVVPVDVSSIKDCPWTLHVEVAKDQTVITATAHKKHEFKIVCKHLDLQTAKATLKASGNVQVTGDGVKGSCENLVISLTEDRLVFEIGAIVHIPRNGDNDAKESTFEIKGESISLRVNELATGSFLRTSRDGASQVPVMLTSASRESTWTRYGTLRRAPNKIAEGSLWQLVDGNGAIIATLVTRAAGAEFLARHEGRVVSASGASEQIDGQRCIRVTHIAVP